jgi:hypothetical protein
VLRWFGPKARMPVEFFAIGTAVRPIRADHVVPQPQMVVSLDN